MKRIFGNKSLIPSPSGRGNLLFGVLVFSLFQLISSVRAVDVGTLLDESDEILIDRLPLEIDPGSYGLFSDEVYTEEAVLHPPFVMDYVVSLAKPGPFSSRKILKGDEAAIPSGDLITYSSPQGKQFVKWQARVIDGRGKAIHEWTGEGAPPVQLSWNGSLEGWMKLKPGEPYNVIFEAKDSSGKNLKIVGEPVVLSHFMHQQGSRLSLMFSGESLFEPNGKSISGEGREKLHSACELAARHSGKPMILYVSAKSVARGQAQSQLVAGFLADILMKNSEEIVTEFQVDPYEPEEVKLQILGVGR